MALTQHRRSRTLLHDGHQTLARNDFPVVENYDANATIQFRSVALGTGTSLYLPLDKDLVDTWLNIDKFSVEVDITPDAASGTAVSEAFELPAGRIATIANVGGVTLDSSTPRPRVNQYTGAPQLSSIDGNDRYLSRIRWEAQYSYANETAVSTFELDIDHGLWGYHNDQSKWLIGLDLRISDLMPTYKPYDEQFVVDTADDPNEDLPGGNCPAGYSVVEASITTNGLPEGGGGLWSYTCALDDPGEDATIDQESDPDGAESVGTFLGHDIAMRRTEVVGAHVDPWDGPGTVVSITIGEYSRWSTWF